MTTTATTSTSSGNWFTNFFHSLVGFFEGIFGSTLSKQIATTINDLAKDDLGKLAIAAVEYVATLPPFSTDVEKRDAAKAKLVADAQAAGQDLLNVGDSVLNMLIELAVQYVQQQTTATAPAPTTAPASPATPTA